MLFGLDEAAACVCSDRRRLWSAAFLLSKGSMGTTPAALCMILVMLPFFLFALYEKNGQTRRRAGQSDPVNLPVRKACLSDK